MVVFRRPPVNILAIIAGAALIVSGCGGDSGTADGADDAAPATAAPSASSGAPATSGSVTTGSAPSGSVASVPPTSAPTASSAPVAAVDVPAALGFTAPLVGGGEIDAASLAGQPVLFWFWAPY